MSKKKVRIIPRLDIKGKNLIKGIQLEGLRVIGSPNEFALKYYEDGADEIIIIDCVASLYNRDNIKNIIEKAVKNIFVPITVGGGIRSIEDAISLLSVGADKIAVNTAVIKNIKHNGHMYYIILKSYVERKKLIKKMKKKIFFQCFIISLFTCL